ncbi:Hydrogenase transcriptional regulatory protein hupR1 [Neorhodopirellula pilleata]|uniref:Hydrogenase transcriptional regulatory protein hupR1 n=1 Tax=Neorhodopirellula pilleata TaxID=2714738 RepID=A0A5C6A4N2_9BACT|nr:Hydrogenase transcriptional regulatory protein hupR1 [Neorhodopirellula pilleata]
MTEKILLVDDDPNILRGFQRQLRKTFDIHLALGGLDALEILRNEGPFAVVVSDMQMPEMSGVELLAKIRDLHEHTIRIMLTGNADQQTAVDAVNQGHIFRFLNKPCSPEVLSTSIESALHQYRLVTAEAELLNQTLAGSVRMLTQVLSIAMPQVFGLSQEARTLARELATRIGVGPLWQIEMSAMLMRLGYVSLPPEVVARYLHARPLTPSEQKLVDQTPKLGHDLIASIPRLQGVARWVASQNDLPKEPTPIAARILKAVGDFQRYSHDQSPLSAINSMMRDPRYDPQVLESLAMIADSMYANRQVSVTELKEGMILEEHLADGHGVILVAKGTEIHQSLIEKLTRLRRSGSGVKEPIAVRVVSGEKLTLAS